MDEHEITLPTVETSHEVVLKARETDQSIKGATSIVLRGTGWEHPEKAKEIGAFYANVLSRTYARLRLGADFGSRAEKSWVTEAGLALISKNTFRPALNDVHGMMVYDRTAMPQVVFISAQCNMIRGVAIAQFLSVFETALSRPREIDDRERVALELFNASFFQTTADSRFLLLMSGLEALIIQRPRSDAVCTFVRSLIAMIEAAHGIDAERDALKQGVGQFQRESIGQAGRRLVSGSLDGRTYRGMTPSDFFGCCYRLRSRLVHGDLPFPTRNELSGVVAQLEVMLSDLLSTDLLDVGPRQ
ncbi:MAG: hypothetical protein NTV14_10260 [Coprothermobacterota bacterium]|nr:hypothetical protein [Coprothermobacterota bacterium]